MIIEKLFLHVLIVLSPIIIYLVLYEGKPEKRNNFVLIVFMTISSFLCVIMPFSDFGILWDLRFVPIVIAFIYGSRTAGIVVSVATLLVRIYVGGDMLIYGVIGLIVNSSFFYGMTYLIKDNHAKSNRLKIIVICILSPVILQIVLAGITFQVEDLITSEGLELLYSAVVFAGLLVGSTVVAGMLYEMLLKRERMQEELLYAVRQQSISELSASIAHEVRNPLTVVKGFLQLMKEEDNKNNVNPEYYQLILSELNRAENIIYEYLNLAKPQLGNQTRVPINECVTHITTLLGPYADKEGVLLNGPEATQEYFIETDRSKLKQALINFIKNAIEASAPTGIVDVDITSKGKMVQIIIADNGKGMTKEQLHKIGTVFYSTKEKGTGLGTMVSIRLIEKMGGKVTYDSKENEGTSVQILLPIMT
ncbi:ATP-binding protein [Alkalicoccobacillus porphyridii]|uniref:histidine kinase n=1 Tax=Alkalicoccobacillus porphyridii TaxID=2597270 RepID=A0A553ZUV2_9BACI|nr:sensor histidine kinase [Alkalicoccobacillus porphyridii]TSB45264.1 GHKL domain-containing protein [Alkalicoccobacillus porphyridii]